VVFLPGGPDCLGTALRDTAVLSLRQPHLRSGAGLVRFQVVVEYHSVAERVSLLAVWFFDYSSWPRDKHQWGKSS
jgi:hypothetical protein